MQNGYKDLVVWQKAKQLAVLIYQITKKLPESERFGLISQMRRAAVSIPSNIAEGYRRNGDKEREQFLRIAFGSGAELETQLEICREIFPDMQSDLAKIESLLEEVMKIINKLLSSNMF